MTIVRSLRQGAIILLVAFAFVVVGSGRGGNAAQSISFGYFNERPFAFIDESNNLTGLDVDLARKCANDLGITEVKGVENNSWDGMIPGLLAKRFDVITSGMTWRAERAEVAAATDPTYRLDPIAVTPKGNPDNIHTIDDIVNGSFKVGTLIGASQYLLLQEKYKVGPDRLVGYQAESQMYADLMAGRIKVAVPSASSGFLFLQANPTAEFELANPFTWPVQQKSVFWFRRDETDLIQGFNACIKKVKEDGSLRELLQKYGFPPTNALPVDATVP